MVPTRPAFKLFTQFARSFRVIAPSALLPTTGWPASKVENVPDPDITLNPVTASKVTASFGELKFASIASGLRPVSEITEAAPLVCNRLSE